MLQIPKNIYLRYGLTTVAVTGLLGSAFYFLRPYLPKRLGGTRETNNDTNDENKTD